MRLLNLDEYARDACVGKSMILKALEKYVKAHPLDEIRLPLDQYELRVGITQNEIIIRTKEELNVRD